MGLWTIVWGGVGRRLLCVFSTKQQLEVWKPIMLCNIRIFYPYTYDTLYITTGKRALDTG